MEWVLLVVIILMFCCGFEVEISRDVRRERKDIRTPEEAVEHLEELGLLEKEE